MSTSSPRDSDLPVYATPVERHRTAFEHGLHPEITEETEFDTYSGGDLKLLDSFEALLGFLKKPCPVCGMKNPRVKGTNSKPSYTFVRGAQNDMPNPDEEQNVRVKTPAVDELVRKKYYPVVCSAGHNDYYLAVASPKAIDEYREYKKREDERRSFYNGVKDLRSVDRLYPEDMYNKTFSKGQILAAIYQELGAEEIDERDLIGRKTLKKSQLFALLARLKIVDVVDNRSLREEVLAVNTEFGIIEGRVKWKTPQWIDFDEYQHKDDFRLKLWE